MLQFDVRSGDILLTDQAITSTEDDTSVWHIFYCDLPINERPFNFDVIYKHCILYQFNFHLLYLLDQNVSP